MHGKKCGLKIKKLLFYTLTTSLPLILLLATEGLLRLWGVGMTYRLLLPAGSEWQVNPNAAAKYFSSRDIAIPELIGQRFERGKGSSVYRIVCLGGSTTAGYPYEVNINFPFFIQQRLQDCWSERRVEVVNLGVSAVNSLAVLDLASQVMPLQPDMVVVYMGHNEFYGAPGGASTEALPGNRLVMRMILKLRQLRLYQTLRQLVAPRAAPRAARTTLMEALIRNHNIPPDSPLYATTHRHFEANLTDLVRFFQKKAVPVVLCTIASNLADQEPLDYLAGGADSGSAAYSLFRQGCLWLRQDSVALARELFARARDADAIRFRAASPINRIIRRVADSLNVPLADSERQFAQESRQGIPGYDFFLEHLHPNPVGYDLIARTIVARILQPEPLPVNAGAGADCLRARSIQSLAGYTLLDEWIGELKVAQLIREYPFNGRGRQRAVDPDELIVRQIAGRHVAGELLWDEAHFKLGDYYVTQRHYALAESEYRAVQGAFPKHPTAGVKIGDALAEQQRWSEALAQYHTAAHNQPESHFLYAKIGLIAIASRRYDEAISALEQLIILEQNQRRLTGAEMIEARYLLALAYARTAQIDRARQQVNTILNLQPNHSATLLLSSQLDQYPAHR